MQQPKAYTVAAITRMIKDLLEESLPSVWVEGEISNYVHHSSGHRYLNLKDAHASLRTTIWRSVGSGLKFEPENGQKVLAFGDITVYEKGGSYQLNCRKLVPVGVGELELAFRQLHEKLKAEGLFEEWHKKQMPSFPWRIGVVTSPTGAAIRDIIQVSQRRNPLIELIIFPARVQGDGAEKTIARGIEYFNEQADVDLLIVGRGGGSLEDIWPFNTEVAVRAIARSEVPVISAVGHEVDVTLSDLVADLRAPTPSAAAELAVWSLLDARGMVEDSTGQMASILGYRVERARAALKAQISRPVLRRPMELIRQRQQSLDYARQALVAAGKNCFETGRNRLSLAVTKLETLSPLKILSRGYSVSRRLPKHQVLRSTEDILPGDRMETLLTDGEIVSFVETVRKDKKNAGRQKTQL